MSGAGSGPSLPIVRSRRLPALNKPPARAMAWPRTPSRRVQLAAACSMTPAGVQAAACAAEPETGSLGPAQQQQLPNRRRCCRHRRRLLSRRVAAAAATAAVCCQDVSPLLPPPPPFAVKTCRRCTLLQILPAQPVLPTHLQRSGCSRRAGAARAADACVAGSRLGGAAAGSVSKRRLNAGCADCWGR